MEAQQVDRMRAAFSAYIERQSNLAFDLYKKLADEGHAESQVFVAWMLSEGIGCTKNAAEAAKYYERAAATGSAVGCFYVGRWLTRSGEHRRAYDFYLQGAQKGHLPSMFRVGYSLARGKGAEMDLPRAYEVLKAAAARGHSYALREIAIQDLRGGRGLLLMPIGIFEFVAALLLGIAISLGNKDSDFLRG